MNTNTEVFNISEEKKQAIADAGWAYRGSDGEKMLLKLELTHEPDALFDLTYDLELNAKDFEEDLRKKASEFNPEKYAVGYFERKGCKHLEQGLVNGKSIKAALDVLVRSLNELDDSEKEKEYTVTMRIEGRFITTVFAKSKEDALEKANGAYYDADFGELRDVDGESIIMEDADGNYVWEK